MLLMFIVIIVMIPILCFLRYAEETGRDPMEILNRIFVEKRRLSKKFKTNKRLIDEYLKIHDNLKSTLDTVEDHSKSNYSLDFKNLVGEFNRLLDVLNINSSRFHNKNDLLVRNFPQAFFEVYVLLMRYDDSLKIIFGQLLTLINGDYDDPHIKEINDLRDEVTNIIVTIKKEVENTIKPYRDEKNELFNIDVKHAKKIVKFEKQLMEQQRVAFKNAVSMEQVQQLN
ncbi:hypothetical protein ES968_22175 (plasmid) [Bacillus subtilis]|uniref:hypothetical protein n=1 Tax=Bacillus subtilis TaxID=1423 RepID=UPI00100A00B8|nr:hypothetical protein [Bacillus subtilis]QAW06671.1 hypothetical protein ES968_22175 [Bacillus subtilis]